MPNRDSFFVAPRLLACAAALLVAVALPAAAQEPTPLQKFLGKIGVLDIPEDPIDYRERAPLVVPPSSALVQPRSAEDITKINPDWPLDHDSRQRTAAAIEADRRTDEQFYSGRPLLPDEVRGRGPGISRDEQARRNAIARRPENISPGEERGAGRDRYSPAQLGFKGWNNKQEESVVFSGEPERRYLTDPPPGLLTPSRDAPYGVVTKRATPWKRDPFDRGLQEGK
ncbi:MAG: hypothetical protein IT539_10065 [Bradyrhizobiaceae bacterium]|nr:hypothetical protein [Bradyrhizobiaceae bacterium]